MSASSDDTNTSSEYSYSVVIFPPNDRQARTMFKLLFSSQLESLLNTTSSSDSKKVAWSDRGWRRREDFLTELDACLGLSDCSVRGVVVARQQTLQEAEELVKRIVAETQQQVQASSIPQANAPLASTSVPLGPSRSPTSSSSSSSSLYASSSTSATPHGSSQGVTDSAVTLPLDLSSVCPATSVRHNIVLYAPDAYLAEGYEWGTTTSSEFIDKWYSEGIKAQLCQIMLGRDVDQRSDSDVAGRRHSQERTGAFRWSDRGWFNKQLFLDHTKASLKCFGKCSLLRRVTLSDALEVFQALEGEGFAASLFVTPSLEAEKGEEDRPVVLCPQGHPTATVDNAYQCYCSACYAQSYPEDTMMRCSQCDYDLCSACVLERTQQPCPVLLGRHRGESILHPSTSALVMTPPATSGQSRQRSSVDAFTFLSAQVVGDNTSVRGGADEEAAMRARLEGVFGRMGVQQNAKPKMKASAIDALKREVVGESEATACLKDDTCIICMNEFKDGEVVMKLPCNHWFHEGVVEGKACEEKKVDALKEDEDEEDPCDGIIPWLKTSNKCPMCRKEMEADTSGELGKLIPALSGPWTCPGCKTERTSFTCEACDVRRNVTLTAQQLALPFFEVIDELFFDFLSHHERKRRGLAASVQELEVYYLRINFVLSSSLAEQLFSSSWMIKDAVDNLLRTAFKGCKHFPFSSPWMDANSKALYVLLVERLQEKISHLNLIDAGVTFELPPFGGNSSNPDEGGADWTCPLCYTSNASAAKACVTCGCESKVLIIAESDNRIQNVKELFQNAESFVFRCFDIMTGRSVSDGMNLSSSASLRILEKEMKTYLGSLDIRRVEHAGWKIICHLSSLFAELCSEKRKITFQYFSDVSSAGLYAVLVRRLRYRLAQDTENIPAYAQFSIQEPRPNLLCKHDEDYESLRDQRFYVHGEAFGMLQSHRKLFVTTAHLIAENATEHYWGDIVEVMSQFGAYWSLDSRVKMLKKGERDLDVLAEGLESFAKAVVEALLRKVVALETALRNSSEGLETNVTNRGEQQVVSILTPKDLRPDTSIDVAVECLLQALKSTVTAAMFEQSMKFLLKTLRTLISNPHALSSRKLRKTTPAVAQCVLVSEDLLALVARLGFVDEGPSFSIIKLDIDIIQKSLSVVEKFAAEIDLK